MKYTYEFTYETTLDQTVIGSWEVRVEYTYSPGRPMKMYLRNGDPGYPAESPEIEITGVFVEDYPEWRPATDEEYDMFETAIDKHFDDMCEAAESDLLAVADEAAEHAAEVRRERRIFGDDI